ncbi:hypothetical protein M422DRAFT_250264 [Sphaerobolus stellatus SS14]|uniref:Uncharacterized protein n=1 Tax=Sphaerobolus stellatus (strain SS14) TaxID=990650 RepID=A0A0C9W391_SPHS4|nr:hypothetical protein M422DRAFT_250264 [Sphaerobolus stellatus SS14]
METGTSPSSQHNNQHLIPPMRMPLSSNLLTPCQTSSPLAGSMPFSVVSFRRKGATAVEGWVIGYLMKKLSKFKTPSFLKPVVIRSFSPGSAAPVLAKSCSELTPDSEANIGVDIAYNPLPGGEMRITDANAEKKGDKPHEISSMLAAVMKKLVGNMIMKVRVSILNIDHVTKCAQIKNPPSNCMWYVFTTLSQMEISIELVVSDGRLIIVRDLRWPMASAEPEKFLPENFRRTGQAWEGELRG